MVIIQAYNLIKVGITGRGDRINCSPELERLAFVNNDMRSMMKIVKARTSLWRDKKGENRL